MFTRSFRGIPGALHSWPAWQPSPAKQCSQVSACYAFRFFIFVSFQCWKVLYITTSLRVPQSLHTHTHHHHHRASEQTQRSFVSARGCCACDQVQRSTCFCSRALRRSSQKGRNGQGIHQVALVRWGSFLYFICVFPVFSLSFVLFPLLFAVA